MFRVLFFLLLLNPFQLVFGLEVGPQILRVCLDNTNKTASVTWQKINDVCLSFKSYKVYSSKDAGPWILESTILNASQSQEIISLSDVNAQWRFKIVTYSACNGKDSFESNIQSIDDNRPTDIQMDSISFDQSSQLINIGWSKNISPDTKGYRIYSYSSPISNKITDTDQTSINLLGYNLNNPTDFTISTFDSCDLFGGISSPQRAAYLSATIDTCKRTVSFNWQPYKGWNSTEQYLVMNKNNTGFQPLIKLSNNAIAHQIANINLGDQICYYIRTVNTDKKTTASSNTICFNTRKLNKPTLSYLSNVTVENDDYILIKYKTDNISDIDRIKLERSKDNNAFQVFSEIASNLNNQQTFTDHDADFNSASYSYRVSLINKCHETVSVSNIGKSIFLSKPLYNNPNYNFRWNEYLAWENGIDIQKIESSTNRFTWNTYNSKPAGDINFIYNKEDLETDSLCFRINNTEKTNSQGLSETSYSNIRCIHQISDFYFPEVINPNENNVLKVYGKGIDPTKGNIEIYNRWGERIFMTKNVTEGWNGKINGQDVELGLYVFKAQFYDQQNNSYQRNGTVLIIR